MLAYRERANEQPSYDEILTKWEDSKEWFMLWLIEICGLTESERAAVDNMIRSDLDVTIYSSKFFDGDFDNIKGTLEAYRQKYSSIPQKADIQLFLFY